MVALIRSVIIPAAGQGTRLLPLTKAVPKELLPVYDRPILQFALDESVAAGARRIVIVINEQKASIRDYVKDEPFDSAQFRMIGKHDLAEALTAIKVPPHVNVTFAVQDKPLGLGHAVLCAAHLLEPGPIGVILPDDIIFGRSCLAEMATVYTTGHMVAAMEVAPADTSRYGIFRLDAPVMSRVIPVRGLVEKPPMGTAPSTLAAVGRYILSPCIISTLAATTAGAGGEIQLTDAIADDAREIPLTAYRFSGERYDCGSIEGLYEAGFARRMLVAGQLVECRRLQAEFDKRRLGAQLTE